MTVYPFETAAYTTPVGSVSEPVLSQFGYHLIKVSDRRPDPGERLTAHIMLMLPSNASDEVKKEKEKQIREIYQQILPNWLKRNLKIKIPLNGEESFLGYLPDAL